jgi:hypothetical protein
VPNLYREHIVHIGVPFPEHGETGLIGIYPNDTKTGPAELHGKGQTYIA